MITTLAVAALAAGATNAPSPERFEFSWETSEGDRWWHRAQIERPDPEVDTGFGVALFGGGLAHDLSWTTPGSYESEGRVMRLTIDGQDTRDGDTLAEVFVDAGFSVLRFEMIRVDDALRGQNGVFAEVRPFADGVVMARAAWGELIDRSGLVPGRVFVVAHSLGAVRSTVVTEGGAAGYAFMAGAYLSPMRTAPSRLAALAQDEDAEGEDHDGSGAVEGWERAATRALRTGETRSGDMLEIAGAEFAWPIDVLEGSDAPVLAVWGGRDTTSYHGPIVEWMAGDRVETVYYPELGHNLGATEVSDAGERLTGPIDGHVVDAVVGWVSSRADAGGG